MAMTHIKTGSQFYIFLYRMLYKNHATGWIGLQTNSGSAPSKCNIFCLVYSVHTGSGELSASSSVHNGISFLRCKTCSVCEADNSPP